MSLDIFGKGEIKREMSFNYDPSKGGKNCVRYFLVKSIWNQIYFLFLCNWRKVPLNQKIVNVELYVIIFTYSNSMSYVANKNFKKKYSNFPYLNRKNSRACSPEVINKISLQQKMGSALNYVQKFTRILCFF